MVKKEYNTTFVIGSLGKMKIRFTLAMAKGSMAMFALGKNIDKWTGKTVQEARGYGDSPDSAYIFGMCNVMNDGDDVFYYTNASRMKGRIEDIGMEAALLERNTYELGHLAFLMFAMNMVKEDKWVLGKWPCVGEGCEITEEEYVEMLGKLGELIGVDYMRMYHKVIG
jgi:hypothetical protein